MPDPETEECELAKGDCCVLVLGDNGGVWEKHNPWLRGMDSPVRLSPVGREDLRLELTHASFRETSGQWKISPSPIVIARMQPSLDAGNGHLSLKRPCAIDIRLK